MNYCYNCKHHTKVSEEKIYCNLKCQFKWQDDDCELHSPEMNENNLNNNLTNERNTTMNNSMNLHDLAMNCRFFDIHGDEEEITSAYLELWDALFASLEKFYGIDISHEFKTMGMLLNVSEFKSKMREIETQFMENPVFAEMSGIADAFNQVYLHFI